MNAFVLSLIASAAVAVAVACIAALLVLGALGAAALLPRGAPLADRLRRLAGWVPRSFWGAVGWLDGLVLAAAMVAAVVLAFALS